jgi:hypothetical protein
LVAAEELDRAPEVKLGPAVNAMERRAARVADAAGRDYAPVTERGRAVHETREARRGFAALREELRERVEVARAAYGLAHGEGQDRVSAGPAAMRAALEKQREAPEAGEGIHDRLRRMLARDAERGGARPDGPEQEGVRARLDAARSGCRSTKTSAAARGLKRRIGSNRSADHCRIQLHRPRSWGASHKIPSVPPRR